MIGQTMSDYRILEKLGGWMASSTKPRPQTAPRAPRVPLPQCLKSQGEGHKVPLLGVPSPLLKPRTIHLPGICVSLLMIVTLAAPALEGRIVAIGDVHGDLTDFASILRHTGLINDKSNWIGGGTVLVQVGDVVDRGPKSRECLNLLMALSGNRYGRGLIRPGGTAFDVTPALAAAMQARLRRLAAELAPVTSNAVPPGRISPRP